MPDKVTHIQAPLRLEGDDLFFWATMVAELEHGRVALRQRGNLALAKLGLSPDDYVIDNEGFIRRKSEQDPAE